MKNNDTKVTLQLHINDEHESAHADSKKEFYKDELESLPAIAEGDVNINTTYIFDLGDKVEVGVYFRNGISKTINFDKVPLKILNSKGETVATQIFKLREIGNIPAYSAVPWKLYFNKENISTDVILLDDGWHVVFDTNVKAMNTVKFEFENVTNKSELDRLNNFLDKMSPINLGTVNISLFEFQKGHNDELIALLIIRNGVNSRIQLTKIPVTIKNNENNKIVAKGTFDTKNMEVSPLKAKLFRLEFRDEELLETDFKINSLSVYFNELNI